MLGVFSAIDAALVARPVEAVYDAHQVFAALMAAWGAGYGSLEAMHERDARALGVILGLERSPSVRTLHRAIAEMGDRGDPIELDAALMRGILAWRGRCRSGCGLGWMDTSRRTRARSPSTRVGTANDVSPRRASPT